MKKVGKEDFMSVFLSFLPFFLPSKREFGEKPWGKKKRKETAGYIDIYETSRIRFFFPLPKCRRMTKQKYSERREERALID